MQSQVTTEKNKCPQCGCDAVQFIERHPVCISCGLVIDQANQIEDRSPRRNGSKKKSELLKVLPVNREQYVTPRYINVKTLMDSFGISDSVEEKIALTIALIIDLAGKLSLSDDVIEIALNIYESIAKKSTFKGKSIRALSAAIIYAASKKAGKVCGLHEISRAAGIKTNKIFKCYRLILEKLGYNLHYPSIDEYVTRICGRLALNESVVDIVRKISATAKDNAQMRGAIICVVAASIYMSSIISGERRTQKEIAEATGITETTLRTKYKEITEKLQIIVCI
ncbi:MAG: hypothetical protein ACPLKQ_04125 [Candidatus Bathyarchaeales archaeon]